MGTAAPFAFRFVRGGGIWGLLLSFLFQQFMRRRSRRRMQSQAW